MSEEKNMIMRDFLEPITEENISELKVGDWIWDNKQFCTGPLGFRRIVNLDLEGFMEYNDSPFMLTTPAEMKSDLGPAIWSYFRSTRYYKFKAEQSEDFSNSSESSEDTVKEELLDRIARFFENDWDNWNMLKKTCWLVNGRSDDLRALLKKAMESEEESNEQRV